MHEMKQFISMSVQGGLAKMTHLTTSASGMSSEKNISRQADLLRKNDFVMKPLQSNDTHQTADLTCTRFGCLM